MITIATICYDPVDPRVVGDHWGGHPRPNSMLPWHSSGEPSGAAAQFHAVWVVVVEGQGSDDGMAGLIASGLRQL